uniref:Uncharacterized protein n=1 Tax=Arundo donax TaxID=35708 RepID=A0A0A9G1F3_ARUDO
MASLGLTFAQHPLSYRKGSGPRSTCCCH